jgi:hypothetical protein
MLIYAIGHFFKHFGSFFAQTVQNLKQRIIFFFMSNCGFCIKSVNVA